MSSLNLPTAQQSMSLKVDSRDVFPMEANFYSKRGPVGTIKSWLRLNSFGGRLFWMIMLGALAGMGGMAFLFSEMLKRQAEEQVRSSIDSKINAIASVTESAETLAYSLGVSATTLHERGAQFPDTYRELVLQLFEGRPDFILGLGLGQSENGLLEDQSWLFPYYSVAGKSDSNSIRYEDFADQVGEFYPETQRYQQYFLPQRNVWTGPYTDKQDRVLTYYYPLFGESGSWLGTTLVNIDTAYLSTLLNDAVFQQAGNFVLVTESGEVIASPASEDLETQTYESIPGLAAVWLDTNGAPTGFVRGDSGYWAYATVPGQDWRLFGFVPYKAIYGRIVRIVAITTGVMGLLLGGVVFFAISKLNQRIKPILLQGNEFASKGNNNRLLPASADQDELEQLSLSFFNILNQVNLHQETIRQQQEDIVQANRHADQVTEKFLAFTTQVDEEVKEQQTLIQQVQQQLKNQANEYRSVDHRLDSLFMLAQTLGGFLDSLPSEDESAQLFDALEQRLLALTGTLNTAQQPDKANSQALINQLIADVASLKAYDHQRHSLEKLHHQTNDLTKARQATLAKSQAMTTAAQSIRQILTEVESITATLNRDAQNVSDMLWSDLQQPNGMPLIVNTPMEHLNLDSGLEADDVALLEQPITETSESVDSGLEVKDIAP
ncbi:MAG: cache domain-containing protein [Cyanobacteria bacterium P01_D01_bin.156]